MGFPTRKLSLEFTLTSFHCATKRCCRHRPSSRLRRATHWNHHQSVGAQRSSSGNCPTAITDNGNTHSGPEIFQRSGEFPNGTDAEYPVTPTAIDFYKNGPSYMQRHLPLWLSVHVQRAIAVLVAGVAVGIPLFHYLPLLYKWSTRPRLLDRYGQLKALEASFDAGPSNKLLTETQAEVERIEYAVSHIRIPLTFTDQLYQRPAISTSSAARTTARATAPGLVATQ